jgi:PiT family inorganic phosphate transporter
VGGNALHFDVVVAKILVPAIASPLIAGLTAATATFIAYRTNENIKEKRVSRGFRAGQNISATLVSLAHGTNDAQKTMGIITLTFVAAGIQPKGSSPFLWVIAACGITMALGTYIGGWRIISTLGKGITDVDSPQGFAAETSAAAAILASGHLGFALSTTHVCSGAVLGSGIGRSGAQVRWNTAVKMVVAWVLTLPASALAGAIAGKLAATGTFGTALVAVAGIAVGGGLYVLSRRNKVTAETVTAHLPVEEPATELVPAAA